MGYILIVLTQPRQKRVNSRNISFPDSGGRFNMEFFPLFFLICVLLEFILQEQIDDLYDSGYDLPHQLIVTEPLVKNRSTILIPAMIDTMISGDKSICLPVIPTTIEAINVIPLTHIVLLEYQGLGSIVFSFFFTT